MNAAEEDQEFLVPTLPAVDAEENGLAAIPQLSAKLIIDSAGKIIASAKQTIDPEKCLSFTHDPNIMPDEFIFPDLNFEDSNRGDKSLNDADFANKT